MRPLIVIEGNDQVFQQARRMLWRDGWRVVDGWADAVVVTGPLTPRVVHTGTVQNLSDAAGAVITAISGSGLLVHATASREVLDLLYEDLRHLGSLHVHGGADDPILPPLLPPDQQHILRLLLEGQTLPQAAEALSISPRTADRRIAAARRFYRVKSTAEALRAARPDLF
jgi:hypothetical protein